VKEEREYEKDVDTEDCLGSGGNNRLIQEN
jgi:hypothetical protein